MVVRPSISLESAWVIRAVSYTHLDVYKRQGNTMVRNASNVISTYVYSIGLASGRFDFATAVGLFQTVVGVVLVLLANWVIKRMGQEGIV